MLRIGEGFTGVGAHSAHVSLLLGPNAVLSNAFALAAASPRPGHIPFQVVLKPNVAVMPATLFIAKSVLRDAHHERITWGPAQAGVAAGITRALLEGLFPVGAESQWLAIALVWVDPAAADTELLYANNAAATHLAASRAMANDRPDRAQLVEALASIGNPYFTPNAR
jgi:5,6,7,8-tetrahydromethanopterin hydro-lyase